MNARQNERRSYFANYAKLITGNVHWEFLKWLLNPQRLTDTARYLYETVVQSMTSSRSHSRIQADFLAQREQTFASGKKHLESSMGWKTLSQHKLDELELVYRYCVENKLRCILMPGPVHEQAYIDLERQMARTFGGLDLNSEYFRIDMTVHAFPNEWMGDTMDHVDVRRRPETTRVYWESISRFFGS